VALVSDPSPRAVAEVDVPVWHPKKGKKGKAKGKGKSPLATTRDAASSSAAFSEGGQYETDVLIRDTFHQQEEQSRAFLKNMSSQTYDQVQREEDGTLAVQATWLKNPKPVAAPMGKARGGSKCPALFRKGSDGACKTIAPGLPKWCLTPMQEVDGARFVRLPVSKYQTKSKVDYYKTYTPSTGSQPVFETFIKPKDVPDSMRLDHFLLHSGNKWAVKVGPKPSRDFVASKDLPAMFDFSTCAIVGSSGSMLKSSFGKEIDSHTFVMRFNQAPTVGYEKRVGSKTSLRLQNQERTGSVPTDKGNPPCLVKGYNFKHDKRCKLLVLSPQFMMYTKYFWYFYRAGSLANRVGRADYSLARIKMSTGMIGLTLAMHLCGKVDLYGFSGGRGHYYQKTAAARSDSTPFAERHPWQIEKSCISHLSTKLRDVHVRI